MDDLTEGQKMVLDIVQDRGRILIADVLDSRLPKSVQAAILRELSEEALEALQEVR